MGPLPVLRGAAWHAGAAPEEVHFKLLQMGAAAALLIFFKKSFMCMGVLPAYMSVCVCVCVCLTPIASKARRSCIPLAGSQTCSTETVVSLLLLHHSLPFLNASQIGHLTTVSFWSVVLSVQWRRTLLPDSRAVPQPGNSDGHGSNRTESAREEEDAQSIKSSPTKV